MKLRFSDNISARWLGRVLLAFLVAFLLLAAVGYGALRSDSARALVQGIGGNPLSLSLNVIIAIAAGSGAVIILLGLQRAKVQEDLINRFFRARGEELLQGGPEALAQMPLQDLPQSELSERLELIVAGYRNRSRIDPATLAEVLAEREQGRVAVARYIASSLVLIGLLGTFIGLVVTVDGVTEVVSALDVGQNSDMEQFMGQLKEGIRKPLDGMGLAFSTSLVGLASSLVLGVGVLGLGSAQASWTGKLEEITAIVSPTAASSAAADNPSLDWPPGTSATMVIEKLADAGHFLGGAQKAALDQLSRTEALVDKSASTQHALAQQVSRLCAPLGLVGQHYADLSEQGQQTIALLQQSNRALETLVSTLEESRQQQEQSLVSQEQNLRQALSAFHAGVVQTLDARRGSTPPPAPRG